MTRKDAVEALLNERGHLIERVRAERAQLERLQEAVERASDRLARDEAELDEIDSVLGRNPQLRLEDADIRLRGRRLEEVALRILAAERGPDAEVHYREWYEMIRDHGHLVSGKRPLESFLAQINRSPMIERVGRRSGRYRIRADAA